MVGNARTAETGVDLTLRLSGALHPRASSDVNDALCKRLVERNHGVTEASDPSLVAEGLGQGLSQRDGSVLDAVVTVDLDVSGGGDRHVDA